MKRLNIALLAAFGIFAANQSHAADLPIPYNHVDYKKYGNNYTWTPLNGATPSSGNVSFPPRTTISTVEPKITTYQQLPFDRRINVADAQKAKIVSDITKAAAGRAILAGLKIATPLGAVATAVDLLKALKDSGILNVKNTTDGLVGDAPSKDAQLSDGRLWWVYDITQARDTPAAACQFAAQSTGYSYTKVTGPFDNGQTMGCYGRKGGNPEEYLSTMRWTTNQSCPAGWYKTAGGCSKDRPSAPISEDEILQRIIDSSDNWSPNLADAVRAAVGLGAGLQVGTPTVSGPSSVPGAQSSSSQSVNLSPGTNNIAAPGTPNTQPGTQTTTKTDTTNVTYSGNTATTSTTTNTTTNITNNVTNITITENKTETKQNDEKTPEEQEDFCQLNPTSIICEKGDFSDKDLPKIPKLYERKYPDGMVGIWEQKKDMFMSSGLGTLAGAMMPTGLNAGSCPSFQIDLSMAAWADFGVNDISPPCWVWDFGKVVILISAVILARQLIFGG